MHIFYLPHIQGNSFTLPEDESKHCIRVLRMGLGHEVTAVDGRGNLYTCLITDPSPKRCAVEVTKCYSEYGKRSFYLHVAIAPTKNIDRFEWFLEKATEIGIDEITPLLCEHSERKTINLDRVERVVVSAMKQSLKAYMPKINPLTPFSQLVASANEAKRLIAYCGDFNNSHAKQFVVKGESLLFLIGPEGDFSQSEVQLATQANFKAVGLGSSRLRTETAGVVACTVANTINEG